MEIRKLSDDVKTSLRSAYIINSIPQCVNELVLNSLDAKSTLIAVRVNLQTFRLQVVDNGIGIGQQNLESTGMRYYTTKCHSFRDYKNNSKYYGYKGETLASILDTCKKLLISTRFPGSSTTFCKTFENKSSTIIEVNNRPSPGTTVTVEDFMFNLPVRQNRVNIDLDLNEIKLNLEMLSIMNPEVSFSLRNDINKKTLYKTDKVESVEKALITIYKEIEPNSLSHIKIKHGKISVAALIYKKLLAKHQIIYVNKRYVHCENLQNHINKVLQKSLISKDSNCNFVYVINIKCPYSHIDLTNMNKVTVEFRNWEMTLKLVDKLLMKFLEKENLEVPREKTPQMVEVVQKQLRLSNMKGMIKATAVKRKIARNCEIISRSVSEVRSIKMMTCSNKKIKLSKGEVPNLIDEEKISNKIIRENFKRNFDENLKNRKFIKDILCIKSKKPNLIQEYEGDEVKDNELDDCDQLANNFKKPNRKLTPCIAKLNKLDNPEVNTHYNTTFTELNQRLITIDDVDNQVVGKAIVMDKFLKSLNYRGSRLDKTTTVSMSVKIKSQRIRQIRDEDNAKNNVYLQSDEIFNFTLTENCDKFKANAIFNENESILNYRMILKEPRMFGNVNKLDISITECEEPRNRRIDLNSIIFEKRTRVNSRLLNTSFSQLRDFRYGPNIERCSKNRVGYENNFGIVEEQAGSCRKNWYAPKIDNGLKLNQSRSRKANIDLMPCLPNRFGFTNKFNSNQIEFNENVRMPYVNFEADAGFRRKKENFTNINDIRTKIQADKPYNPIFGKFIEPGDRDETNNQDYILEQPLDLRNIFKSTSILHNNEFSIPLTKDYFCFNRNKNKIAETARNFFGKRNPENFDTNHPRNNIKLRSHFQEDAILPIRNETFNPKYNTENFKNHVSNYENIRGTNFNKYSSNMYDRNDNFNRAQPKPKNYYNNTIDTFFKDEIRNIYKDQENRHHQKLPRDFVVQNEGINSNSKAELFKRGAEEFNGVFNCNRDNVRMQRDLKLNHDLFNKFAMRNEAFDHHDREDLLNMQINQNINGNLFERDVGAFKEQNRIYGLHNRENLTLHDLNPNLNSELFKREEFGMKNGIFDEEQNRIYGLDNRENLRSNPIFHDLNPNLNSELFKREEKERKEMKKRIFDVDNIYKKNKLNYDFFNRQFQIKNDNLNNMEIEQNLNRNFFSTTNSEMNPNVNFNAFNKNFELGIFENPKKSSAQHEVFTFKGNKNEINPTCDLFRTEVEPFKVKNPISDFENRTIFPSYQSHSHSNQCNLPFSLPINKRLIDVEEVQDSNDNFDFINEAQNFNGRQNIEGIHNLHSDFQFSNGDCAKNTNLNVFKNNPILKPQIESSSKPIRKALKNHRNVRNQITQTGKSLKLQQEIAIKNVLERRKSLKEPSLAENLINPKFGKQNSESQKKDSEPIEPILDENVTSTRFSKQNSESQKKETVPKELILDENVMNPRFSKQNSESQKKETMPKGPILDEHFMNPRFCKESQKKDIVPEVVNDVIHKRKIDRKLQKVFNKKLISPKKLPTNTHLNKVEEDKLKKLKRKKNCRDRPLIKPSKLSKPIAATEIIKPNQIMEDVFPKCIVKDADSSTDRINERPEMKSFANLNLENSNSSRSLLDSECNENNKTKEETSGSIIETQQKYAKFSNKNLQEISKSAKPKHFFQSPVITTARNKCVSLVEEDCNKNLEKTSFKGKKQDFTKFRNINDTRKEDSGLVKQSSNKEKSSDLNEVTKSTRFEANDCSDFFDGAIFDENKVTADKTVKSKTSNKIFWQPPYVTEVELPQKSVDLLPDKSQNFCNSTFQKICDKSQLIEENIKSTKFQSKFESGSDFWDTGVSNKPSQNTNKKSSHSQKLCDLPIEEAIDKAQDSGLVKLSSNKEKRDTRKEDSGLVKQSSNKEKSSDLNNVAKSTRFKADNSFDIFDGAIFNKNEVTADKVKPETSNFWQSPNVTEVASTKKSVHLLPDKSQNVCNITFQKICDKSPLIEENIKGRKSQSKFESGSDFWDIARVSNKPSQNTNKKSSFSQKLCDLPLEETDRFVILDKAGVTEASQMSLDFWNSGDHAIKRNSNKSVKSPLKTQKLCNDTFDKICVGTSPIKKKDVRYEPHLKSQGDSLDILDKVKSNNSGRFDCNVRSESQKKSFDFLNIIRSSQKLCNRTFEKISDKSPCPSDKVPKPQPNSLDFLNIDKSSSKLLSDRTLCNNTFEKIEGCGSLPKSRSSLFIFDSPSNANKRKSSQKFESSPPNKTQKLCDITFQKIPSFDLFDDKKKVSGKKVDGNIFHNISDIVDLDSFNFIKSQKNNEFPKNYRSVTKISIYPKEEIDNQQTEDKINSNTFKQSSQKMTKSEILEFENNDLLFPNANSAKSLRGKSQSDKIRSELLISLSEEEKNKLLENELNTVLGKISEESTTQNNNEWVLNTDPDGNKFYVNLRSGMTMLQNFNDSSNFKVKERLEFVPKGLSPILCGTPIEKVSLSLSGKIKLYKAIAESYKNELGTIKWQQILNNKDPRAFFNEIYKKCRKKSNLEMLNVHKGPYFKTFKTLNFNVFTNKIFDDIHVVGQWDKKFIVTLGQSKTLLLLFDQHAVHERIRVEKLYSEYTSQEENNIEYKRSALRFKIKLNLGITEINILSTYKSIFEKYGLKYQVDDKDSIVKIKEIPTCLLNKTKNDKHHEKLKELVVALIEEEIHLIQSTKGVACKEPNLIRDTINSEACRGAVMFGDNLSLDECKNLIKDLSVCNLPFQCAHGRPTLAPIIDLRSAGNPVPTVNLKNLLKH